MENETPCETDTKGNNDISAFTMTEDEVNKALAIPERDTKSYPDIDKDTQIRAGTFMYKMNLLADSADGNLKSLVWELYSRLDDYLHLDRENSIYALLQTLEDLKAYLKESDNIIFRDIPVHKK